MTRIIHTCYKCLGIVICKSATRRPEAVPCKQKGPIICAECAAKSQ